MGAQRRKLLGAVQQRRLILCYDADIAARVCTPSELKRKHGGAYEPNSRETWLDVQARALYQACNRIRTICRTNGLYCKGVQ